MTRTNPRERELSPDLNGPIHGKRCSLLALTRSGDCGIPGLTPFTKANASS